MGKIILRFLAIVCTWVLATGVIAAQTDVVRHTVGRGETLASIAKRYAVTEEKIIELNPDAAKFVYVGMQLIIPETAELTASPDCNSEEHENEIAAETVQVPILDKKEEKKEGKKEKENDEKKENDGFNRWGLTIYSAYGIVPTGKAGDFRSNGFTYSIVPGFTYSFTKSFYIGAGIGYYGNYNNTYSTNYAISLNQRTQSHMIYVPVEVGFRLYLLKDKISLIPYAGIDNSFIVKAISEERGGDSTPIDLGNDIYNINGRVGLRLNLWGFNLGAAYCIPFISNGKGFPEISIGFTL